MLDSSTIALFVLGFLVGSIGTLHAVYRTFRVGSFISTAAMLYTIAAVIRDLRHLDERTKRAAVAGAVSRVVPAAR